MLQSRLAFLCTALEHALLIFQYRNSCTNSPLCCKAGWPSCARPLSTLLIFQYSKPCTNSPLCCKAGWPSCARPFITPCSSSNTANPAQTLRKLSFVLQSRLVVDRTALEHALLIFQHSKSCTNSSQTLPCAAKQAGLLVHGPSSRPAHLPIQQILHKLSANSPLYCKAGWS